MEKNCSVEEGHSPVPDLDLEIWRGRGGVCGHTDPVIRGGGGLQIIFSTLRALLWSKNITPRAPPLDPPMFSQPSQRKRVLNEKQADPFARAKSWQQRTRMLRLSRPARFDATGRDKVFMSYGKKCSARRVTLPSIKGSDPARWVTLLDEPSFSFSCKWLAKFCKEM